MTAPTDARGHLEALVAALEPAAAAIAGGALQAQEEEDGWRIAYASALAFTRMVGRTYPGDPYHTVTSTVLLLRLMLELANFDAEASGDPGADDRALWSAYEDAKRWLSGTAG